MSEAPPANPANPGPEKPKGGAALLWLGFAILLVAVALNRFPVPTKAAVGFAPPAVPSVKEWLGTQGKTPSWGEGEIDFDALKGKVVVLQFWSSWCHECRGANLRLNQRVGHPDLVVIGVTMRDPYVEEPQIRAYAKENLSFPTALLNEGYAIGNYGVSEIPHGVIVDRAGRIVWIGKSSSPSFEDALTQALSGKTPAPVHSQGVSAKPKSD